MVETPEGADQEVWRLTIAVREGDVIPILVLGGSEQEQRQDAIVVGEFEGKPLIRLNDGHTLRVLENAIYERPSPEEEYQITDRKGKR